MAHTEVHGKPTSGRQGNHDLTAVGRGMAKSGHGLQCDAYCIPTLYVGVGVIKASASISGSSAPPKDAIEVCDSSQQFPSVATRLALEG